MLEHPRNYFDSSTKLFSNLYLVKYLGISAKSFFPCSNYALRLLTAAFDNYNSVLLLRTIYRNQFVNQFIFQLYEYRCNKELQ